jgi:1-acyl-sn-glycerol-3-phosphate acyltransferase
MGAIPTRRYQVDPQSVRVVLRLLDEGWGIGVFPEGERSWDATLQAFRTGSMRLVLKSDVPVIPCGIAGTYGVCPRWDDMKWHKIGRGRETVTIRYGKPILFGRHDCRASREQARPVATQVIEEALLSLIA